MDKINSFLEVLWYLAAATTCRGSSHTTSSVFFIICSYYINRGAHTVLPSSERTISEPLPVNKFQEESFF